MEELSSIPGVDFRPNIDLSRFTTMKLKSSGNVVIVNSISSLEKVIQLFVVKNIKYTLLGWGANQIFHQHETNYLVKLDFPFDSSYLEKVQPTYRLPASVSLNLLTSHAMKFGLIGWEVFTGVPASLGGAVYMNAGTNLGEIGHLVSEVKILRKSGQIETIATNQSSFSYRKNNFVEPGDAILEVVLRNLGSDPSISNKIKNYLKLRQESQPLSEKTCGCVFKNNPQLEAGKAIDLMGLKGLTVHGVRVSHKHANFMENFNNGSSDDFYQLKNLILDELYLNFGIKFELEVKIS